MKPFAFSDCHKDFHHVDEAHPSGRTERLSLEVAVWWAPSALTPAKTPHLLVESVYQLSDRRSIYS